MGTPDAKDVLEEVLVSAPGKLILHGEHAVVHGSTALAASLNLRSFLCLKPSKSNTTLSFPDLNLYESWEVSRLADILQDDFTLEENGLPALSVNDYEKLKEFAGVKTEVSTNELAVVTFLYLYLCIYKFSSLKQLPPVDAVITSTLPIGAGLGSSAAFSVCLSAGFLIYTRTLTAPFKDPWSKQDKDLINKWAYEGERVIHGNPSGIDNVVSVLGGTLRYKSKVIEPLVDLPSLKILLINTNIPRRTKVLVAGVKEKFDRYPDIIRPLFESINHIAIKCESVLSTLGSLQANQSEGMNGKMDQSESYKCLEELVEMNQYFLQIIGVSHQSINQICDITSKVGIRSKLTGAGGGGCVFAILRSDQDEDEVKSLQENLMNLGFESWITTMGGIGVSYHRNKEELLKSDFLLPKNLALYI